MKILIAYATYSGGTEATAEYIKQLLEKKGHDTTLTYISNVKPSEIKDYDISLFGSPSWLQNGEQGQPHALFFDFFENYKNETFENTSIALFGLGDETYTYFCGAVDVISDFFTERQAKTVTEPLRIENFYIDNNGKEKQVQEWIEQLMKDAS